MLLLVCSCEAGSILAFSHSTALLRYNNHLARCLDSTWWICRTRGRSATSARQPHYFINRILGSQRVVCASSPAPSCLSICAGSEHAPVPTVPWCSLAGPLNHLTVTGGGNTTAGIGSPKVASGPLLSEVFGLLPLEVWICHIFSCGRRKRIPFAALGRTENVNKIKSFFFLSLPLCTLWLCESLPVLAWRISSFAFGFTVLVNKCFVTALFLHGPIFLWVFVGRWLRGAADQKSKPEGHRWSPCDCQMLPVCVRTALSLFNWLWLLARDQLSHAFVRWTWDRTGNARDILFLRDVVIVLLGEFLARKTPFTVIGCE